MWSAIFTSEWTPIVVALAVIAVAGSIGALAEKRERARQLANQKRRAEEWDRLYR